MKPLCSAPAEGFYATEGLGNDEMRIAYVLNKDAMRRGVADAPGLEAYNSKKLQPRCRQHKRKKQCEVRTISPHLAHICEG